MTEAWTKLGLFGKRFRASRQSNLGVLARSAAPAERPSFDSGNCGRRESILFIFAMAQMCDMTQECARTSLGMAQTGLHFCQIDRA
jgi:hypothetical protein